MRLVRPFLPSESMTADTRAVIVVEAALAASKLSIPFLTLYLVQVHGLDFATAGLYVAVRGLGGLLAVMVAGAAADRFGEKPVVVVLLAGASASAAMIPNLDRADALLAGFFVLGAFVNAVQPAFSSLIIHSSPARSWTELYAAEYWALNVGFAITALVGGRIAAWAFDWLFYLEAVGTLVALLLVIRLLPSPTRVAGRPPRMSHRSRAPLARARDLIASVSLAARDRLALALISSTLLFAMCLSQMTGTLPLDMEALGYSPDLYGYAIFWNGAMLTLFQIGAGRVISRRNSLRVLAGAAVVSAIGYSILSILHGSLLLILISLSVWTLGEMMDAPVRSTLVSGLALPGSRARYLGLVSAALTIGYCVGPWLGGWVLQEAGREALWLGTGACALVCAAIRYGIAPRVEHRIRLRIADDGAAATACAE